MALGSLSNEILNTLWKKAYNERHGVFPLFQFVMSLAPRRDESGSLKGEFLVASDKRLALRKGVGSFGRHEIAVSIDGEIGVADILLALPMPLECEALEFAAFLAKSHADVGVDIPADIRRRGEDALRDFLRAVKRKARPSRRVRQ